MGARLTSICEESENNIVVQFKDILLGIDKQPDFTQMTDRVIICQRYVEKEQEQNYASVIKPADFVAKTGF